MTEALKTTKGDKLDPVIKSELEQDPWDKHFICHHVIVNFKQDKSKKEPKGKPEVISLCVMCGEKVKDDVKRKGKKEKKKSILKQEVAKKEAEKLVLRRESSSLSDLSDSRVDSQQPTRRKDSKFSLFGSRRSNSSIGMTGITSETLVACAMHGHKKLKYFCEDHQEICCSVCLSCLHPKCERVMYIKDEINTSWEPDTSELTAEALRNVRRGFEEIIDVNSETKHSLEKQRTEARNRRNELRSHIIKLLDDFEWKSEKQMDKFISIELQQLNSVIDTCNDAIANINNSLEVLEFALDSPNAHDLFVATHKATGQKSSLAMALSEAIKNTKDVHIDFVPETDIASIENITSVGAMYFSAEEMEFPETLMKSVSKIRTQNIRSPRTVNDIFTKNSSQKALSPRQLTNLLKYSAKLPDDKKTCENVGIAQMEDGKIVLIDLNNWKVKVFDSKFRQGTSLQLTSGPRGVVAVGPQELAISLPDESKLQIVSIGKTLKPVRSILTEMPCYGIANHDQKLVLLCDDGFSTTAVQFIDLEGKLLRKLEMKKTSSKTVLKNPWSLTLTPDGQKVCITDRGRLVCMDLSGKVIFIYKHDHLENARGVTIDSTGKFYVCGSNNIHQVSPDGTCSKILLQEEDILSPHAICYDAENRTLLVTSSGSDVLSVFKVKKL